MADYSAYQEVIWVANVVLAFIAGAICVATIRP